MDRLVVKGPTRSKLPVDEQCRRGTSGKASFSTYLQTANEGGEPCRPNKSPSLAMPFLEAVQEADPRVVALRVAFRISERTFLPVWHVSAIGG